MTRDDGRNLTGKRLQAFYRAQAKGKVRTIPASKGRLSLESTWVADRDQAYALAFEIMAEADRLWPA